MVSSRQTLACILLIFGAAVYSHSQTGPTKEIANATVTGKVTWKGKGVQGVVVTARLFNSDSYQGGSYRATTDPGGNYRITNVAAGTYRISLFAPLFVPEEEEENRSLVIADGETVNDVNFKVLRGAVITGKVTNSDAQPLIAENVFVVAVKAGLQYAPDAYRGIPTDDRGVYRAFGLRPGKYKVAVGLNQHLQASNYRQTFHPSVIDEAKATVIEVREGSEVRDVDVVVMRGPGSSYKVDGQIVDGESGRPIPNVPYGLMRITDDSTMSIETNAVTDADGEFAFENVAPGHYSVFIVADKSDLLAQPAQFEVVDGDVKGLMIKAVRGASLSGTVVFEGAKNRALDLAYRDLLIWTFVNRFGEDFESTSIDPKPVNADGTFTLAGLRSGIAHLTVEAANPRSQAGIVRIERNGVIQTEGIPLQGGEQVTGLRVVVKQFTGAIRGQLKFENGELPPSWHVSVLVSPIGVEQTRPFGNTRGAQVDERGRFSIEGLNAGTYDVQVSVIRNGTIDAGRITKQRVAVADNAITEVVLSVK